MGNDGVCLSSRDIRGLLESGRISGPYNESMIQPSSFDPTIGDEAFVIDTDNVLFRSHRDKTIYRSLLELPKRRRQRVDISDGLEVRTGFSYLIPLEQRVSFGDDFRFIKSSPKSSIGRVFPSTRLLTDYSSSFDEVLVQPDKDKELMMWLLFQPLAFNLVLSPRLSLNQLRFVRGFDSQLTPGEVLKLWERNPLLYSGKDGSPVDNPDIGEALQVHVDLEGFNTEGIVALRARGNPNPIDLRKKGEYSAEEYFEPVKAVDGVLTIRRGKHYLLSSAEVLNIPRGNNVELRSHSHQGLSGPLHRAGFVDNGFRGDLVFELTSQELTDIDLRDGNPIGELVVHWTTDSDKVYGGEIGSNYKFQNGPKVAKYFEGFDYKMAAKNHEKLDRVVLVQDARLLLAMRDSSYGFESVPSGGANRLIDLIEKNGFFHSRYDCEKDGLVLQVIPYVLGFGPDGTIFSYVRAKDIENYGDSRLFGKHSLGLGGHIVKLDGPAFIRSGLEREVYREEADISGDVVGPKLLGTLYQPDKSVDKVHFGLVYGIYTDGKIVPKESSIISGRMLKVEDVLDGSKSSYETWSNVLIPRLSEFRDIVLKS